ncbi:proline-rich protein 11 isoform X1 [Scyliorhinus canicula]|uniref:proline-rich protein 11 isoform X1 n=1 Tax=Scyliorhinus canicula TaxID=7830 RepID=UPI0018F69C09|nr:proline-rich protein 11 isoform X1 [Scyliorhinus canicula]XP_038670550.1 proline-rich protein 11 isoform X1 [Scyliorhinus canicula]XP_038670551.1 proline-rich protein 11 isoform X1 [Scyliorhinus canicula]XP_038670552.1 proline-rich protein 11 isoform X1 [Scyliorhinus canicula]
MPKLSQRHRKWKTMRKRQAMEKAWNDSRRSLLARNKRNVCKAKPIIAETAGKKKIPASISNSFQHECVPNRLTSLVNVKNMLNPLKAAISSLYNWWLNSIGQGLDVVKDILFPSRVYLRELNALRQHMEILEKELTQLHKIVDVNLASNNAKAADTCSCRKYIDFSASPAKIPVWPVQPIISRRMLLETFGALPTPAPTPPPPPPPPPPPLPPPSVFVQKPLQIQRKSRSENSLQTLSDKIGRLPSITMKDLLKVKLKKTADRFELKKTVPERIDGPLPVTVKDLLEVKLRKTQNKLEEPEINTPKKERSPLVTISDLQGFNLRAKANRLPRSAKMITTLNKPVLDLRQRLKKVAIERSPGGTPLYKENRDTGTGLTPVMTQALKRKFEMAHPKSPPCCLSPNTSFDDQIAS